MHDASDRHLFILAAHGFAKVVAQIGDNQWQEPALGEWTVRDLVGHTTRALTTVQAYLKTPVQSIDIVDVAGYYDLMLNTPDPAATHKSVADRGRESAAAMGDSPKTFVAQLVGQVVALIETTGADATITSPAGGMTLDAYLGTRVFELTIHGYDLCKVIGIKPPAEYRLAFRRVANIVMDFADAKNLLPQVLDSLLGRSSLPTGFALI